MYRIFCESLQNYMNQFKDENIIDDYRLVISRPLQLLTDVEIFIDEERIQSLSYKQLGDLLLYINQNRHRFEKLKAFLWTLESRGIKGRHFGVASLQDMEEQAKLLCMFLDLLYWDDIKH